MAIDISDLLLYCWPFVVVVILLVVGIRNLATSKYGSPEWTRGEKQFMMAVITGLLWVVYFLLVVSRDFWWPIVIVW